MCTVKMPETPPPPPPVLPATPPRPADSRDHQARSRTRRAAAQAFGRQSTFLGRALNPAYTKSRTLLGG